MTVYSDEQITAVGDAEPRQILTGRGLPEHHLSSFRAAPEPSIYERDPRFLVIGTWELERTPICLDLTAGAVAWIDPASNEWYPVNTSLTRFSDFLDAITYLAAARPVTYPVHYPRPSPTREAESYKWFVANERSRHHQITHGRALPHVRDHEQRLPYLDSD